MRSLLVLTALPLLLATGCSKPADAPLAADPAQPPAIDVPADAGMDGHDHGDSPVLAEAVLAPTAGSEVGGTLHFLRIGDQLRVKGEVTGLAPGSVHGFHIHENGDCSAADGSSAGGHFNPTGSEHGAVEASVHHGGDMPNLQAGDDGRALVDGPVSASVTLGDGSGSDILGRGLIVHADPDDYTSQPTGNAGARLACAVIEAAR